MLNEACQQLKEWHEQGFSHWTMAVNVSAVQFDQPDLGGTMIEAIDRHGNPPELLTIEVTETVAMRSPEITIEMLSLIG